MRGVGLIGAVGGGAVIGLFGVLLRDISRVWLVSEPPHHMLSLGTWARSVFPLGERGGGICFEAKGS